MDIFSFYGGLQTQPPAFSIDTMINGIQMPIKSDTTGSIVSRIFAKTISVSSLYR
jgi:hypothetical protein